jgi:hypothetical protein
MTETAQTPHEPQQRMRALEQANAVRLARAELKRRIAEGEVSAAEVILGCPDVANRWTLAELLVSQRRWGSTRCRKFLERNSISEIKLIGDLTDRQRRLLAEQLQTCVSIHARLRAEPAPEVELAPVVERRPVADRAPVLERTQVRERELVLA